MSLRDSRLPCPATAFQPLPQRVSEIEANHYLPGIRKAKLSVTDPQSVDIQGSTPASQFPLDGMFESGSVLNGQNTLFSKEMKTLAAIVITTGMMIGSTLAADPSLTKEAVRAIGAIILSDKSTKDFHGRFCLEEVEFDQEKKIWRFPLRSFPVVPGAAINFFEIRDKDAYFRIGSVTGRGYSPWSSERFRMPPALRNRIISATDR